MVKTHNIGNLTWIDVGTPDEREIRLLMEEYKIPEEAAEDLLSPTPKQTVSVYPNCVYLVLHFPILSQNKTADHRQEIDFIVGEHFLITVHYDKVKQIDNFRDTLGEIDSEENNGGFLFHRLTKHLYHSLLRDVDTIRSALHKAETSIFKGEERKMVQELSRIHRDILRFRNAILPHREAIVTLHSAFKDFLGEKYERLIHDMSAEYQRVERRMQANKELLDELRLTNDSLLSSKQNEAIKSLTMMAFCTFPLTLIAALFAMRTETMPIIGLKGDFWIIILMMLALVASFIGYFSYKKWL